MKYIKAIGVELEGGWEEKPNIMKDDGSVEDYDGVNENAYWGEVASQPIDSPENLKKFINEYYPEYVNETCGLHFHFSFKENLFYSRLLTKDFYDFFLQKVKEWGEERGIKNRHFWNRLAGENQYCHREYRGDMQKNLRVRESVRYCHLNYCYGLHTTLEVRLFPMFKGENISLLALDFLINVFSEWLDNLEEEKEEGISVSSENYTDVLSDEVTILTEKEVLICV